MSAKPIVDTDKLSSRLSAELEKKSGKNIALAELLGVSPQYLNNIKCGRKPITLSMLIKSRKKLGLNINKLIDECC